MSIVQLRHSAKSGSRRGLSLPKYVLFERSFHALALTKQVLERHAQLGYQAAAIYPLPQQMLDEIKLPGDIKGRQWDAFHDLIIIDEIARCGYLGVIWGLTCGNQIGCPPLVNFGTEEQMRRFLPDVYAGRSRFCLGVTEPDGESS